MAEDSTSSRSAAFRFSLGLMSLAYLAWSAAFIYRSSFVAFDGHRYYCLFDDAMVSMRYAWNLAHGMGAVWNPGGASRATPTL